jgi:tetratricopeptide (TPR) repeat protein
LNKSLSLAPRNPEALALQGFLLAAQNQTREAVSWFDRSLAVEPCARQHVAWARPVQNPPRRRRLAGAKICSSPPRLNHSAQNCEVISARLTRTPAIFHARDKEFQLAKKLDPNDPTAWLYSALLDQERNQINDAIRDLEKSEELNDNRSVYRSQLLLDQDRAVRSANLATTYRDAGMFDVSVNEAARAVNYDYANYSAHLFLANSYDELRDPNEINLRYETPRRKRVSRCKPARARERRDAFVGNFTRRIL